MLLLLDRGRGFGVFWRLSARRDGCFLIVDTGRDTADGLLGVMKDGGTLALALLLPGAVMDSLDEGTPNLFGVAGIVRAGPSLVVGLLPFDMAEDGRGGGGGGGMLLSPLKKLDLRLPLLGAGEGGSIDRVSIVLSESDGLRFFDPVASDSGPGSSWSTYSDSASFSRNPALELALEDALDAERKPFRLPKASSSLGIPFDEDDGREGAFAWREGGRAKGRLKTDASLAVEVEVAEEAEFRVGPKLGMPLTRREEEEEAADGRRAAPGAAFGAVDVVGGALGRASESLDVFFCSVEFVGRDIDCRDGFLRSVSVDDGARSCDWLAEGLSTGRRDGAGLGMPDGRGMDDEDGDGDGSMVGVRATYTMHRLLARNAFMQVSRVETHGPTRKGPVLPGPFASPCPIWGAGSSGLSERGREGGRCPVQQKSCHVS
jgi:hypothetical protein